MTGHLVGLNDEPGTGTQYHVVASPPCGCRGELDAETCGDINHEHPNTYRRNDRTWKVGREYFDTIRRTMTELVGVVLKSGWHDTGDPEDGTLLLQFDSDRDGELELDPAAHHYDPESPDLTDRFIEVHVEPPRDPGAPDPPY